MVLSANMLRESIAESCSDLQIHAASVCSDVFVGAQPLPAAGGYRCAPARHNLCNSQAGRAPQYRACECAVKVRQTYASNPQTIALPCSGRCCASVQTLGVSIIYQKLKFLTRICASAILFSGEFAPAVSSTYLCILSCSGLGA